MLLFHRYESQLSEQKHLLKQLQLIDRNIVDIEIATLYFLLLKGDFREGLNTSDESIDIKRIGDLLQINDSSQLDDIVDEILQNNPKQVQQYLSGKEKVFAYFIGQAMKASKGKANPGRLTELFKARLKEGI